MQSHKLKDIVIVGGGTAGWMSAAFLSSIFKGQYSITLVESDQIGIIGVGEATIPPMLQFNKRIGLSAEECLKKTNGTIKLGIQFRNWGKKGDVYNHAFGLVGVPIEGYPFRDYLIRVMTTDPEIKISDYAVNNYAIAKDKFNTTREMFDGSTTSVTHAYHFDAALYAKLLRERSEATGIKRIEGKIIKAHQNPESGSVEYVELEDGLKISGDLFIDCSGMRALLIEETLKTGYEDWSDQLMCDRALAVQTENTEPPKPYTQSTAHEAGWQWRIPLQHRTGNGHVFSSKYMSDDEAESILRSNIDGELITDPRLIKFRTGKRKKIWNKNVVSIGLSSGFLEPLESTSIYLIQLGIRNLSMLLSNNSYSELAVQEYNNQMKFEYESIRDFIITHYYINQRNDEAFWRDCAEMEIPDSLKHRLQLFKEIGTVTRVNNELFAPDSWFQVLIGQNFIPESYSTVLNNISDQELNAILQNMKSLFESETDKMLSHADFIKMHCASEM